MLVEIKVGGTRFRKVGNQMRFAPLKFNVLISNDDIGKTISINDGETQFTIPFEPLEKYLK